MGGGWGEAEEGGGGLGGFRANHNHTQQRFPCVHYLSNPVNKSQQIVPEAVSAGGPVREVDTLFPFNCRLFSLPLQLIKDGAPHRWRRARKMES